MLRKPAIKNRIAPSALPSRFAICLGLSLTLPVFVFFPILGADFVFWDDDINLFNNRHMIGPLDLSWLAWAFSDGDSALRYKPLNWLVWKLWIEAVGFEPWGFHFLSLTFHALNCALLFVLLRLLFRALDRRESEALSTFDFPAVAAALLWAVHPMRVEAVAWITGFPYLLSTTFFFAAIICFLEASSAKSVGRMLAASSVFLLLSFLSYPLALLFPAVIVVWDLWKHSSPHRWRFRLSIQRCIYHTSTFLAAGLILGYNLIINFRGSDAIDYDPASNPVSEPLRWIRGIYGLASYVGRWIFPADLAPVYFNHHFFVLNLWPETVACLLLLAVVVVVVYLGVRHRFVWIIGIAAYFALTVPTAGFLVEYITFGDRYAYQGHLVLAAMVGLGIFRLSIRFQHFSRWHASTLLLAVIALFSTSALLSRQQLRVWHNTESLMLYVEPMTRPYPGIESMMLVRRGLALASGEFGEEALVVLRRATEIAPGNWAAWHYRGLVALANHHPQEALDCLNQAQSLQFDPDLEPLRQHLMQQQDEGKED